MTIPGFSGRIHPAGWPFIGVTAAVTLVLWPLSVSAGWVGLLITGWCAYFFRDPDRVPPLRRDAIVSAADGIVQAIGPAPLPAELGVPGGAWTRISIFLSIFDVHVNRMPISGKVVSSVYHPGQFFNASLDKASELNERHSLLIQTSQGVCIGCVQIAGLIARRIVCDAKQDMLVQQGQRFGIIRFGSRVDVYIPSDFPVCIQVGQRAIGGETILADVPFNTRET